LAHAPLAGSLTVATRLGVHADRLANVRALRSVKGRREQRRFAFEGATLLEEATASGFSVSEIYATEAAYESTPLVRELEAGGISTFLIEPGSAARISDLSTPSGILATAPMQPASPEGVLAAGGPVLVLADLNDPANAGTLLRSADAFGSRGVIFGSRGIDPYHPKVVRGSMGAIFRLAIAVADPTEVAEAAAAARVRVLGLAVDGVDLSDEAWASPLALVVGNERQGLGRWEPLCDRLLAVPMIGRSESLSAAVAGSIALYEACRSRPRQLAGKKQSA
jgi:RNA methyltransferase, TrmH family